MKNINLKIITGIMIASMLCAGCGKTKEKNVSENTVTNESVVEEVTEESTTDNETEESVVEEKETKEETKASEEETAEPEKEAPEEEKTEAKPAAKESGTPVANHGELSVKGTQLVDKNGKAFQIKGVSTHGLQWFPEYVNKDTFKTIRDEWGANCIRLAMYTAENGYCEGGNKDNLKKLVNDGVEYATDLGMYVIIDWHILHDLDPNKYKSEAIAFFDEMSKKYANYDNVLYEICNEPNGGTSWASIKSYAEEVIPVIKANNPDAIIIVGTPTWSQDVDQAAADPIKGYTNIMYTLHFYADTHKEDLRNKMTNAIKAGLPIFVTEFGTCDASGNGAINKAESDKWISVMDANGVSYCIWNLSNKNETSSLIASGCNKKSGWTENELSEEGRWYVGVLHGKATGETAVEESSSNNNNNNNNSSEPAATANSSNISASITPSGNSWQEGSSTCVQYTLTVKNTSQSTVKDWKITVNFGTNISLNNSWNGKYTVNGSNLVITPEGYNSEISAGSTQEVGFIIKYSGSLGTPTITIN